VSAHLEDRLDRLLLGGADEAAGIDDDHLRLARIPHHLEAGLVAHAEHDLGIDAILGAAERYKMNGSVLPHLA